MLLLAEGVPEVPPIGVLHRQGIGLQHALSRRQSRPADPPRGPLSQMYVVNRQNIFVGRWHWQPLVHKSRKEQLQWAHVTGRPKAKPCKTPRKMQ